MIVCPACGQENPDGFRFCGACGAELAAPPPAREERKVVTVLFCDLVGFTSRSEQMDVEDVRGTLVPYHQLLRRELERHGGTVEKFIGDAVMALFGAPVAHEDDPERAVRAGLAILDAVAGLVEQDPRLDLHVRIGIMTGEALVALSARPREGEGMASGDVVNTAARMQTAAPVDGILVGDPTYRATSREIDYEPAEPVAAKGKADPVPAWRAVGARSRFGTDVRQESRTPMVGRDDELELVWSAFARSSRERTPQLVTLIGAPGIGKSRLVWELFQRVDSHPELTVWRQGRCLSYGEGVAYWALGEIVKAQAGILESDQKDAGIEKLRRAVAGLVADAHDAEWVTRHLAALVGGAADEAAGGDRAEVFAAWRRFLEALAEQGPAVLVFEDVHWADDGLLDFLDHLSEWAGDLPLLILCTARPELIERRAGWGGGKANALTIALRPLSEADTARVVARLLDQAALPADAQQALLARAEGNPLYAEEYVRMLVDGGLLVRTDNVWRYAGPEALPLPETLHGLVSARLDALTGEEKSLLQDAAVLGKVFWLGAVAAAGGVSRWQAEAILHRLERRELIRRERQSSVASEAEYAFRHVLTRDVAYEQIPRRERARRHRRAAEWIESLAEARDDQLDPLAHHYLAAVSNLRASGDRDDELEARASAVLRRAGARAYDVFAFPQAERMLAAALEITPRGHPEYGHIMLWLGRARAAVRAGGTDELAIAMDVLMEARDVEAAALAEARLGEIVRDAGASDEGWRLIAEAWARVCDRPDTEMKVQVLSAVASTLMMGSRFDEAEPQAERLLDLATRLDVPTSRVQALYVLGICRGGRGDRTCFEPLEEAVKVATATHTNTAIALANLATARAAFGELRVASALMRDGLGDARRLGKRSDIDFLTVELAVTDYHAGAWDEVEAAIAPLRARDVGAWYLDPGVRVLTARMAYARGDTAAAVRAAREAVDGARRTHDPQVLGEALAVGGRLAGGTGDEPSADVLLADLIELISVPANLISVLYLVSADLARIGEEMPDRRAGLVEVIGTLADNPWAQAALAHLDGRHAEAADRYEAIGALPDAAYARMRTGEGPQLERAAAFWRSVGATRYLRLAEAGLEAEASA